MIDPNPVLGGPWRILVLDRNPEDPKWLIATVTIPADVRHAMIDLAGRYADWANVTEWVRDNLGRPNVAIGPMHDPLVWTIHEDGRPR
jgi:hypothetical protein